MGVGVFEPLFSKIKTKVLRNTVKIIVISLVGLLLGAGFAVLSMKIADARCIEENGADCTVPWSTWSTHRFNHKKFDHSHGVKLTDAGIHKLVVRVRHKLNHLRNSKTFDASKLPSYVNTLSPRQMVNRALSPSNEKCWTTGAYNPYSGPFNLCNASGDGGDTKQGVQRAGEVIFCGGGVALGWLTGGVSIEATAFFGSSSVQPARTHTSQRREAAVPPKAQK